MSNQPNEISNPVKITRIEMVKQYENTVINMYTNGAQFAKYPILQLLSSSFGMLAGAGIDPNSLEIGSTIYCDITADWQPSTDRDGKPRLDKNNKQRINPTRLHARRVSNVKMIEIHAMLCHIIDSGDGMSSAEVILQNSIQLDTLAALPRGAKIIVQGNTGETNAILESVNGTRFTATVAGASYDLKKERFLRTA